MGETEQTKNMKLFVSGKEVLCPRPAGLNERKEIVELYMLRGINECQKSFESSHGG